MKWDARDFLKVMRSACEAHAKRLAMHLLHHLPGVQGQDGDAKGGRSHRGTERLHGERHLKMSKACERQLIGCGVSKACCWRQEHGWQEAAIESVDSTLLPKRSCHVPDAIPVPWKANA